MYELGVKSKSLHFFSRLVNLMVEFLFYTQRAMVRFHYRASCFVRIVVYYAGFVVPKRGFDSLTKLMEEYEEGSVVIKTFTVEESNEIRKQIDEKMSQTMWSGVWFKA